MTTALLLGPALSAVSGVSTHLRQLLASPLSEHTRLIHFQVGSEGRRESLLSKWCRLLFSPAALAWSILRHRITVVHLNTSMDRKAFWRDTVYLVVARLLLCKVVYQVHGGALPQDFTAHSAWRAPIVRLILSLPQVIVLLGSRELAAYRHFVPQQRVQLIANAVDVGTAAAPPRPLVTHRPLRLVYLGRLVRAKGLYELLEAVATLRLGGITTDLTLAGSGSEQNPLQQAAATLRLGTAVHFKGAIFGAAINDLWQWGDVLVYPSYAEGLPYALLEGMAAGLVPVATSVGAIPDVITDSVQGLLIPPRDVAALAAAIRFLDANRGILQAMSVASQEQIRSTHSTTRMADEFLNLYRSL